MLRMGCCLAGLLLAIGGCAQKRPQPPPMLRTEPMGLQMVRTEAQMKKYPFRILQQFEHPVDLAFLQIEGPPAALEQTRAHTGKSSVLLDKGTRSTTIKLPSLLSGVKWPGQWTLLGAYFFAEKPQRMRAIYELDGRVLIHYAVEIPAGQWTPLLLDVAAISSATTGKVGILRLTFSEPLAQPLWCDDVLLLNNTENIVETKNGGGWSVQERGFRYTVKTYNSTVTMKMPEAAEAGWRLEEANAIRARFHSTGKEKNWVIYADGKQYIDSMFKGLGVKPSIVLDLVAQHEMPAQVTIPEELGRVNRNSPGDSNNDGYDELTGTYHLIATTSRIEFTLTPRNGMLIRPVIEISSLPPGPLSATVDGKWADRIVRLENGDVLLELPGEFGFPTTANVKVGQ
jgi:hypothetical protein